MRQINDKVRSKTERVKRHKHLYSVTLCKSVDMASLCCMDGTRAGGRDYWVGPRVPSMPAGQQFQARLTSAKPKPGTCGSNCCYSRRHRFLKTITPVYAHCSALLKLHFPDFLVSIVQSLNSGLVHALRYVYGIF